MKRLFKEVMAMKPELISGLSLILSVLFFAIAFVNAKKVGLKIRNKEYEKIGLFILIFAIAAFLEGVLSEISFLF